MNVNSITWSCHFVNTHPAPLDHVLLPMALRPGFEWQSSCHLMSNSPHTLRSSSAASMTSVYFQLIQSCQKLLSVVIVVPWTDFWDAEDFLLSPGYLAKAGKSPASELEFPTVPCECVCVCLWGLHWRFFTSAFPCGTRALDWYK